MYNYGNLSDYEFELLCRDIVQAQTNVKLSCFGKGADGGIDANNLYAGGRHSSTPSIIVQAKHYQRTPYRKLKREAIALAERLGDHRCDVLFFMTSAPLSPANVAELRDVLCGVASEINVRHVQDIDDYLQSSGGKEIVYRHFKLWMQATDVISTLINNGAYIDCDELKAAIEEKQGLFVSTSAFVEAERILESNRFVMLVGSPGVGKTTTSQMLALRYVAKGYRLIYTTDANVATIKNLLSHDPTSKEFILLDDFLGQSYWKASEARPKEIEFLIAHCARFPNKRLVLNSRITILNDIRAKESDFDLFLDNRRKSEYLIDVDAMSSYEKARILHSHLVGLGVDREHISSIVEGKFYISIVNHPNYNPRIIEYACAPRTISSVPSSEFARYIKGQLDHPQDVWKNEYEQRMSTEDRILVNTLYSLTNSSVSVEQLKAAFEQRIQDIDGVDLSLNHFEGSLRRLTGSMLKVSSSGSRRLCSVANPSINDFLATVLSSNAAEQRAIISKAINAEQVERMFRLTEDPEIINFVIGCITQQDFWELGSCETVAGVVLTILSHTDRLDERALATAERAMLVGVETESWHLSHPVGIYLNHVVQVLEKADERCSAVLASFERLVALPFVRYIGEHVSLGIIDGTIEASRKHLAFPQRLSCYEALSQATPRRIADEIVGDLYYADKVEECVSRFIPVSHEGLDADSPEWKKCEESIYEAILADAQTRISDYLEEYKQIACLLSENDIGVADAIGRYIDIDEEILNELSNLEIDGRESDLEPPETSLGGSYEIDAMFCTLLAGEKSDNSI